MTIRIAFSYLLGSISIFLTGCAIDPPQTSQPKKESSIPVKAVAVASTSVTRKTTQPATILAYYETPIRARASGYVSTLNVDIGDYVEAGQQLAELDVPELIRQRETIESRIALSQAQERRAAANVALSQASVESAQARLTEARSQTAQADATLAAAEAEFSRTNELVLRGSLQSRLLDEARKRRDAEQAGRAATIATVQVAEAEVGKATAHHGAMIADREIAEAETQVMRRQLAELNVVIAYATITAPFAGVITERHIELGDLVNVDSASLEGTLFVLSRVDKVRVRIPVPESDAVHIARGNSISLSFPSFVDEAPISTTVERLAHSLNPGTRTMTVEAEVSNTDGKLLPGMFGLATIEMGSPSSVSTLPSRAVRFDDHGKAYVYIITEQNTVTVSEVATGLDDGHTIEIRDGLEPGQLVIDAHLRRFHNGDQVRPL
ncbi:MAG: efflux RND transporter periplasmic adaptor subunit [Pirellulaceae bacterium]|nr:efflux RND transporter periplasmic adaptor subunit [Planctomycetales bacterium]